MTISPIGAIPATSPVWAADTGADPAAATGAPDFAAMVTQGLNKLQQVQQTADDLAVQAATGRLTDVHDYMIAATEAQLAMSLTVQVRNKALESFQEIMRMQA